MKHKTNNQMVKALVKEIDNSHPFIMVVFRERLQKIAELTRKGVSNDLESFNNPVFDHTFFIEFCDLVDKHLNAEG